MTKKISRKKREKIWELHNQGISQGKIAKELKISLTAAWGYSKAREKGFDSFYDYGKYRVLKRGYGSKREYERNLEKERQKKKMNRELSTLINKRLNELGKNNFWLAGQIGVSRQMVDMYMKGKSYPKKAVYDRIEKALEDRQ